MQFRWPQLLSRVRILSAKSVTEQARGFR